MLQNLSDDNDESCKIRGTVQYSTVARTRRVPSVHKDTPARLVIPPLPGVMKTEG